MMKRYLKPVLAIVLAVPLLAASLDAFAQQAGPKPETLIKWRQSAYQVLGWNSARIKANVDGQFNKDEVVKAANSIAAIAHSGLGALFAPGSERGTGWHETKAKPELFSDGKRVGELAADFAREAGELAKVAAGGDAAAVKTQFGKLGKACKACHDDFKLKD
jgi:cytochrome c556